MSYSIAEKINVDATYEWLITSLTSGGPAEKAGLQKGNQQIRTNSGWIIISGDIIIKIDGNMIINGDSLMSYIE
jgi:S1-C subfamily serine protease